MKKIILVFLLLFLPNLAVATVVSDYYDNVSSYFTVRVIYNALKVVADSEKVNSMDKTTGQAGLGFSAGVYNKINILSLRYEVDYSYTMKSNSFYHSLMLNIFLEAEVPKSPIIPYIMGGVGINIFDPPFANVESNVAFNFGGGVLFPISKKVAFDLGIRYMQTDMDFHINEGYTKVKNHNLILGMVYTF